MLDELIKFICKLIGKRDCIDVEKRFNFIFLHFFKYYDCNYLAIVIEIIEILSSVDECITLFHYFNCFLQMHPTAKSINLFYSEFYHRNFQN